LENDYSAIASLNGSSFEGQPMMAQVLITMDWVPLILASLAIA
jgi:hypothetical protein